MEDLLRIDAEATGTFLNISHEILFKSWEETLRNDSLFSSRAIETLQKKYKHLLECFPNSSNDRDLSDFKDDVRRVDDACENIAKQLEGASNSGAIDRDKLDELRREYFDAVAVFQRLQTLTSYA